MALKPILVKPKEILFSTNRLECPLCEKRFWMTSKYMDHMATHKHFLLSCNICNEGFYNQKDLDEHYLTHSEVINTYDCNECSKKFLQKYQLEQHKQSLCPATNESSHRKKKSVHFNNVLESRNIDDFSDNDEDYSESDEDFSADYVPYKIFTQTRSGRVVKAKKIFENEVELKHKCARKSKESYSKEPVVSPERKVFVKNEVKNFNIKHGSVSTNQNSITESTSKNSSIENANKNFVIENASKSSAIKKPSKNFEIENNTSKNSVTDSISKNSETQIGDKNSEAKTSIKNSVTEGINENTITENINKNSEIENRNENSITGNISKNSLSENTKKNSVTINLNKYPLITKQLYVVSERIPDHIYKQYVEKGNVCTYKDESQNGTKLSQIKKEAKSYSPVYLQDTAKIHIDQGPISFSLWAKTQKEKELAKVREKELAKVKEKITRNMAVPKKSGILNTRSRTKLETSNSNRNNLVLNPNSKINNLCDVAADIAKITNSYSEVPSKCTPVNEFVYVGPNPNMNKIKEVMQEMKMMSKDSGYQANNLPQTSDSKNVINGSQTDIFPSGNKTLKSQFNTCDINQMDTGNNKSSLNENFPIEESIEGILDKKVVNGFTLIKVTPEYMRKIQSGNFEVSDALALKSKKEAQRISDEVSMITKKVKVQDQVSSKSSGPFLKESTEVCKTEQQSCLKDRPSTSCASEIPVNTYSKLRKEHSLASEKMKTEQQTCVTNIPSTSGSAIPVNTDIELRKEPSPERESEKISNISQQSKEEKKMNKLSELEALSIVSNNEKLFERYRAKLEEKERKKKEKYQFKKKLRYMAKLLGENRNLKKCNKDKKLSSERSKVCEVTKNQSMTKETDEACKRKRSAESEQKSDSHETSEDQFSDVSIGKNNTFTISCPCNSKDCNSSSSHSTVNKNNRIAF